MASRRKQEDKHLAILRELVTQTHNKKCFDCGQRGPTYVNMTIGAFVCTSCSGLLRGLNPPHRIKSISMASFNAQEIEFLQKHGNEVCASTWCALWSSPLPMEPESRDEQKLKDFLNQKYERKRWYSSKPKPKENTVPETEAKPLKTLLGENAPSVVVSKIQTESKPRAVVSNVQPQQRSTNKSNSDLLGDLGSDPFGSSTQSSQNFFGNYQQPPPPQNQVQGDTFNAFSSSTSNSTSNPQSFDFFANQPSSQQSQQQNNFFSPQNNNNTQLPSGTGSDRYAALSDLDLFKQSSTQSVFSDTSVFASGGVPAANFNQSVAANTQPNPFMSPGTSSSGAAVFQLQQEKPANPFLNGFNAQNNDHFTTNQSNNTNWATSSTNNTNQNFSPFPSQNHNTNFQSEPFNQQQSFPPTQQNNNQVQQNQFATNFQTNQTPTNNFNQPNMFDANQSRFTNQNQFPTQNQFQPTNQNQFPTNNQFQSTNQSFPTNQGQFSVANQGQFPIANQFQTANQQNQFSQNNSNQFQNQFQNMQQQPGNQFAPAGVPSNQFPNQSNQFFGQQQPAFNQTNQFGNPPNSSINLQQQQQQVGKAPPFGGIQMPGLFPSNFGQQQPKEFGTWNKQPVSKQPSLKSNNPFM